MHAVTQFRIFPSPTYKPDEDLDLRKRKQQDREKYIMRRFIVFTCH
jgi:hypothetical protein